MAHHRAGVAKLDLMQRLVAVHHPECDSVKMFRVCNYSRVGRARLLLTLGFPSLAWCGVRETITPWERDALASSTVSFGYLRRENGNQQNLIT
jgi:hypothetical protein